MGELELVGYITSLVVLVAGLVIAVGTILVRWQKFSPAAMMAGMGFTTLGFAGLVPLIIPASGVLSVTKVFLESLGYSWFVSAIWQTRPLWRRDRKESAPVDR